MEIKLEGEVDIVIYSVSDNGKGIPQEHLDKIFHIFHRVDRSNREGEGLGLAAVKKILDRNHGRIRVESEPGKGSTFFVSLPAIKP